MEGVIFTRCHVRHLVCRRHVLVGRWCAEAEREDARGLFGGAPAAALRGRGGGRGRKIEKERRVVAGCNRIHGRGGEGGRRREDGEGNSGSSRSRCLSGRASGCWIWRELSLPLDLFFLLRGREPAVRRGEGRDTCLFQVAVLQTMHGGQCLAAFGAFLHRAYRNQAQASTLCNAGRGRNPSLVLSFSIPGTPSTSTTPGPGPGPVRLELPEEGSGVASVFSGPVLRQR